MVRTIADEGLVERFLRQKDVTEKTKYVYRYALRSFQGFVRSCGECDMDEIAVSYRQMLEKKPCSPKTQRIYVKTAKAFYEWCVEKGIVEDQGNAFSKAKLPKNQIARPRVPLKKFEVQKLMNMIANSGRKTARRDYALLDLLLYCGLRRASVANIDIEDIKLDSYSGSYKLFYLGKGHTTKDQWVFINPGVMRSILAYLESCDPPRSIESTGPLFLGSRGGCGRLTTQGIWRAVMSRLHDAGLDGPGRSPHSLRHTLASRASQMKIATKDIGRTLGHADDKTTEGYIHEDESDAAGSVEYTVDYGYERPDW